MHQVLANYTLPAVLNTLKPVAGIAPTRASLAKANAAGTTSINTTNATTGAGLGSTFLNLLSTELQNQDPTAPVDSTAMVGQMISLNQLDQLISINQTLTGSAGKTKTGGAIQAPASVAAGSALATAVGAAATLPAPGVHTLPFDPTTMMPISSGNAAAVAASINSSLNAADRGLTATDRKISGGK